MKKKVLLQVMGAVLVAGLMAGCGGTNDTKTEENTKTEAAADNADAKEETDSTEAEDTSEDSASTDSAEEDSAEADDTAAVNKFYNSRCHFLGMIKITKQCKSFIRHSNNSHIRVNGTEGIVRRFCTCLCQGIKKCTFSYIWKSNDT